MDWKDLKGVISSAAPLLGAAIGGPAGATIGGLVARTLGTDSTPQAVADVLANSEKSTIEMIAARQALKRLENEHETKLIELQLEEAKLITADRQHAREQNKDHWMPAALTIVLALMVAGMFWGIISFAVPESAEAIVYMIAGQVLTAFLTCVAFWVGTSRSSQEKTRLMKRE